MPRLHVVKQFVSPASYHLFNRGNNKQPIFFEEKDYWIFRRYAKKSVKKLDGLIRIEAFALLENHFHFIVSQESQRAITRFSRTLTGMYCRYIAEKYRRTGRLFESSYKAVLLENEAQYLDTRRYVLSNPIEAGLFNWKHVGTFI